LAGRACAYPKDKRPLAPALARRCRCSGGGLPFGLAVPQWDLVLTRIDRLPVLLVATFRPEFQPPWTGQPHATVMSLNRLGRGDGAAMVERLAGNAALLLPDVIAEIVERTDGVPLFVEEMTKAVLEAGAERGREVAASVPSTGLGVPATLQASLMARLDRLGPAAKGIAQIGAAIGREFNLTSVSLTKTASRSQTASRSSPDRNR
jgi:predicted ATPase